jgi:hypothetical protein
VVLNTFVSNRAASDCIQDALDLIKHIEEQRKPRLINTRRELIEKTQKIARALFKPNVLVFYGGR